MRPAGSAPLIAKRAGGGRLPSRVARALSSIQLRVAATALLLVVVWLWWGSTSESSPPAVDTVPTDAPTPPPAKAKPTKVSIADAARESQRSACSVFTGTDKPTYRHGKFDEYLTLLVDAVLAHGPRVGGSESSGYFGVLGMLTQMMHCDGVWRVRHHNFSSPTPFGTRRFTNVLASWENPAPSSSGGHMVLAAHWDSKYFPATGAQQPFLGACDSVVPIVLILELMKLVSRVSVARNDDVARRLLESRFPRRITVMMFDGEEAFVDWKGDDHTYGARFLAKEWKVTGEIETIDLFVLLDLLGPANPTFHNYFPDASGAAYNLLRVAESKLRRDGKALSRSRAPFFPHEPRGSPNRVDDDHIEWQRAGNVSVLHIIPIPFPPQWHRPQDDRSSIDFATVVDLFWIFADGLFGVEK